MRVCGIDPSLNSTGVACDGIARTVPGQPSSEPGLQVVRVSVTAFETAALVSAMTARERKILCVIETPSLNAKGSSHERIVGLHYLLRHMLQVGDFRLTQIIDVAAATLKVFATGSGRADKFDMVLAARERLGYLGKSHDEADALWLEQVGHHLLADDLAVKLPLTHTRALAKIQWKAPV